MYLAAADRRLLDSYSPVVHSAVAGHELSRGEERCPEDSQRDFRTLVGREGDAKLNMLLAPPTGLLNKLLQPLASPENLGIPTPCSVLLRREVVKSVGGFEMNFKACTRIKHCILR